MQRAYAQIPDSEQPWQIHYREQGTGPALVLLHPSPLSSQFLAPQIQILSKHLRCIAWDTPGYGNSDPLPERWAGDRTLQPYVESLAAFIDVLELEQPLIYGSATGAQIAIEFARSRPAACAGLLLENVALFEDEEAENLLRSYFPDIAAAEDGSHLQLIWNMAARSTRFFPWYADGPGAERRDAYPPAPIINSVVRDYLLAGSDYDRAYRAAFANERPERLQDLTVPTRILLWEEGLLGEYGERVADIALPPVVSIHRAGTGMETRFHALEAAAQELLRRDDASLEVKA